MTAPQQVPYTDQTGNTWYGTIPSPISTTTFERYEDFGHVNTNTSITTSAALYGDYVWTCAQLSSGTGVWEQYNETDGIHYGVVKFGNSGATSGYGVALYTGGGSLNAGLLNPTTQTFYINIAFSMLQDVTSALYMGFTPANAQTTIPSASTAVFTGLRFDTSLSDTKFSFVTGAGTSQTVTPSSVTADTGWHVLTIASTTPGSVWMALDGNPATVFSSNIDNATLDFVVQSITRTAAANYILMDYHNIYIGNLVR